MSDQETTDSAGKGTIMLVDDRADNLRALSLMLLREGYTVEPVTSGEQALEFVRSNPPDLILLDIMMPTMDGFEVCRRLKDDLQTQDIPIIFLSALNSIEDITQGFTVGGVDYVTKPFQIDEVLARVATHMALRSLQKQLEEANQRLEVQNAELEERNTRLQEALDAIKTLSGLIPICAWCGRKIHDGDKWVRVEAYIEAHTDAQVTGGMCPDCMTELKNQVKRDYGWQP